MSEPGKERRFCPQSAAAYLRRRAQPASAATSHEGRPLTLSHAGRPRRPAEGSGPAGACGSLWHRPSLGAALLSARLAEG